MKRKTKRKFTPLNLPVSAKYVFPGSRKGMLVLAVAASLIALSYFTFDAVFRTSSSISSGQLSSNHAGYDTECASCHEPGNAVSDLLCSSCHEKGNQPARYDFSAHYLYRSNDFRRISADSLSRHNELPCSSCHPEHNGRQANITEVSQRKCLSCHPYGRVLEKHPEFEFARTGAADDSTLKMTHLRHVVFVLQQRNGIDRLDQLFRMLKTKTMDLTHFFEEACLFCHNPDPDGGNFANIDFERHCASCHIKADALVDGLPIFDPRTPQKPGVETLEQMQQRGGPGLTWTYATNPNLVSSDDSEVAKNPVFHKDSWILENLKQIRKRLVPERALAELLESTADVPVQRTDTLYSEAIRVLQQRTDELRNRTELKDEIAKIASLLQSARTELRTPSPDRSLAGFHPPRSPASRRLPQSRREALQQLVLDLTAPDGSECRKCHLVENARIRRVQSDQAFLIRAEFNHAAHVLQKKCIECHTEIPIDQERLRLSVENHSSFKETFRNTFRADRAVTQNLPGFDSCRECHSKGNVSIRCITCHRFHPN